MDRNGSDLVPFFRPRSIAVFGSFKEGSFAGYPALQQLIGFGFPGNVYPVNPRYDEVLGVKSYGSIVEVPGPVDLVMIMTNAAAVPEIMAQCGEKGVKAAIVVSDGFAEKDGEGATLQRTVVDIARRAGIRIIGPNTAGTMSAQDRIICCAYRSGYEEVTEGPVAIVSQTGLLAPQSVPWTELGWGVSKLIDLANKCDVDESDVLDYLRDDPGVGVIAFHLEDVKDGQRFLRLARQVTRQKPILVLKPGRTQEGARAVASHTGSLAGDDRLFDSLCTQAGIIRVDRWTDLTGFAKALAHQPLPRGNRLGIISATGGGAAMMADTAAQCGLTVARLSAQGSTELKQLYPPGWGGANPVDLGPTMTYHGPGEFASLYRKALDILLADDNVDCIATITVLDLVGLWKRIHREIAEELAGKVSKPIVSWMCGPSASDVTELVRTMDRLGFPAYLDPETPVRALGAMRRYAGTLS